MNNFKHLLKAIKTNEKINESIDKNYSFRLSLGHGSTILQLKAPKSFFTDLHGAPSVGRFHELWKKNCFEIFIKLPKDDEYREYNFSPTGSWQCYDFKGYREERSEPDVREPVINVDLDHSLMTVTIADHNFKLFNICVVALENQNLQYFCLNPTDPPDFHDQSTWVELANI